jgi:hypothetical protein
MGHLLKLEYAHPMPIDQIDGCEIRGIRIGFFDDRRIGQSVVGWFSPGGLKSSISRQMV